MRGWATALVITLVTPSLQADAQEYHEGASIPVGYHLERKTHPALLITGGAILGLGTALFVSGVARSSRQNSEGGKGEGPFDAVALFAGGGMILGGGGLFLGGLPGPPVLVRDAGVPAWSRPSYGVTIGRVF